MFSLLPIKDKWELTLLVDDNWLTSIDGIPELSTSTSVVLHVWNRDNAVTDMPDPLTPPSSTAYFRNLRLIDLFKKF